MEGYSLSHLQGRLLAHELLGRRTPTGAGAGAAETAPAPGSGAGAGPLAACRRSEGGDRGRLEAEEGAARAAMFTAAVQDVRRRLRKREQVGLVLKAPGREYADKTLLAKAKLYSQIEDTLRQNGAAMDQMRQDQAQSSATIDRLTRDLQYQAAVQQRTTELLVAGFGERERAMASMVVTREALLSEHRRVLANVPAAVWRDTCAAHGLLQAEAAQLKVQLAELSHAAAGASTSHTSQAEQWAQQRRGLRQERDALAAEVLRLTACEARLQAQSSATAQAMQELKDAVTDGMQRSRALQRPGGRPVAALLDNCGFSSNAAGSAELAAADVVPFAVALLCGLRQTAEAAVKAEQDAQHRLQQSESLLLAQEGELLAARERLQRSEQRCEELQARAAATQAQLEAEARRLQAALGEATTLRTAAEAARAEAQHSAAGQQQETQRLRDVNAALEGALAQVKKQLEREEEKSSEALFTVAELEGALKGTRQSLEAQQVDFQRMEEQWRQRHCILQGEAMKLRSDCVAWMEQATAAQASAAEERHQHEAALDEQLARHRQDAQRRRAEQEAEWAARLEAQALARRTEVSALRLQLLEMEGQLEQLQAQLEQGRAGGGVEDRTQQDESTAVRRGELSGSVEELQVEMDRLRDVMAQEVQVEADVQRREAEVRLLLELDALRQRRAAELEAGFAEERRRQEQAWATEWTLRRGEARAALAMELEARRAEAAAEYTELERRQRAELEAAKGDLLTQWRAEWDAECATVRDLQEQSWEAERAERRREEERQLQRWRDSWEQRLAALLAELEASAQAAWEQCVAGVRQDRDEALEQWWQQLKASSQQELDGLHHWAQLQVDDHIKQKEGEWERVHARLAEEHERAWAAEVTERRETLLAAEEERRANARRAVAKGVESMWSRIETEWQALHAAVLAEWARGLEALWAQAHEWSTHLPSAQHGTEGRHQEDRRLWEAERVELRSALEKLKQDRLVAEEAVPTGDGADPLAAEVQRLREALRAAEAERARWEEERAVFHQLHGNAVVRLLHRDEDEEPPSLAGRVNVGRNKTAAAAAEDPPAAAGPVWLPDIHRAGQDPSDNVDEGDRPYGTEAAVKMTSSPFSCGGPHRSPGRGPADHGGVLEAEARMAEAEAQLAAKEVAIARLQMRMTREQRQALLAQEEALRGALTQMEVEDRGWICEGR